MKEDKIRTPREIKREILDLIRALRMGGVSSRKIRFYVTETELLGWVDYIKGRSTSDNIDHPGFGNYVELYGIRLTTDKGAKFK